MGGWVGRRKSYISADCRLLELLTARRSCYCIAHSCFAVLVVFLEDKRVVCLVCRVRFVRPFIRGCGCGSSWSLGDKTYTPAPPHMHTSFCRK